LTLTRPREAALHQVATRLFRERGFHATSMQDLAEALGMNRGSLYHYIESKDDLLWLIVSGALARLDEAVRPELEAEAPGEVRLRRAIAAHLRYAADHGDEFSLIQIELRALAPERRRELIARRDAYESGFRAAIADGIAEGAFRATDVKVAAIAVLSTCNWFSQWYRPGGPMTVDDFAHRFADLFIEGLRAPGGELPRSEAVA
jgi:AcrR family transcriptional regulator